MIGRTVPAPELVDVYAAELGIECRDAVQGELATLFDHLSRLVLSGETPPGGTASAEGAIAWGQLWVLDAFLADARAALIAEGVRR